MQLVTQKWLEMGQSLVKRCKMLRREHTWWNFFKKIRGDMVAPISTPFMHKKVLDQKKHWPVLWLHPLTKASSGYRLWWKHFVCHILEGVWLLALPKADWGKSALGGLLSALALYKLALRVRAYLWILSKYYSVRSSVSFVPLQIIMGTVFRLIICIFVCETA